MGFSMAMLNNQRVYLIGGLEHGFLEYSPATNGTELPKKWYAYYFGTTISDWWFGTWLLWLSIYWERSSHLTFIFFRGAGIPTRYTLNIFEYLWMFSIDLFFLPIQDHRVVNPFSSRHGICMAYFSHMLFAHAEVARVQSKCQPFARCRDWVTEWIEFWSKVFWIVY